MLRLASSNVMGEAWMLKADGSSYDAIPVRIHIYGELGNLDANAAAALWMMQYSYYDALRNFLKAYTCSIALNHAVYTEDVRKVKADIFQALKALPYNLGKSLNWSKEQVADTLIELLNDMTSDEIYDLGETIDDHSGDFVAKDLNELFIRVRMNNEYNAGSYNGVCYFRIGSTYKNWTNQIWAFVHDHSQIKKVVVERDAESDGELDESIRNVMINNMDRDEFLSAERLPFLGSKMGDGISKVCYLIISAGKYSDLGKVRANASRVEEVYQALRLEDIKQNYKRVKALWGTTPQNR